MAGDPDFPSVQLLLHGDGSNGSTTFTDSSRSARTLTVSGNAQISTTQSKFGGASMRFDGTGDRLQVSNAVFALGTGDFTIEMWLWPVTGGGGGSFGRLIAIGGDGVSGALYINRNSTNNPAKLIVEGYASGAYTTLVAAPVTTLANDTWHHVALTRSGTTWTLWLNGSSYSTGTSSYNVTQSTLNIAGNGANNLNFNCYMDDLRITKGVARYTDTFTPATAAFPNNWEASDTLSETAATSELSYLGLLNEDDVTELLDLTDPSNLGYTRDMEDLLFLSRSLTRFTAYVLSDTLRSQDFLRDTSRYTRTATDGIGTGEVLRYDYGMVVRETLRLLDPTTPVTKYSQTLTHLIATADRLSVARPVALTEGVGVARVVIGTIGAYILDQLRLTELIAPKGNYKVALAQSMRLSDTLLRFLGGSVSDSLATSTVLTPLQKIKRSLAEGLGVADVISPRLLFRVLASDTVGIDDAQVLKLIYRSVLTDAVQISAAYVSPSGSITTWAINTKTGAVTEYGNYEFNSFARSGFKYLGASSTGLYELDGDDDAGTDIVSVIKSGLAQFGGSRFTAFKAAYLGIRGEGDFYLRLETGRGEFYNYKIVSQDMNTTKVQMGKGLRARYFSFQLTSTGQDFDLESVEFVPLVAQRRV